MEKLERYLDQVCRGIGGSHKLRQHIREELREHLMDVVAKHQADGMNEEEAVARALNDFGGPEQMRSEFESLYGHRMMATVIEKAIQWKEKTMKAKWLWTTWVYLALVGTLVVEALFMLFVMVKVMPLYVKFSQDKWFVEPKVPKGIMSWMDAFLQDVVKWSFLVVHYWYLFFVVLVAVWVVFEWLVRSENKTLMRLAALATAAVTFMVPIGLTATALIIQLAIALPEMYTRNPDADVRQRYESLNESVSAMQEAMAKNDWDEIQKQLNPFYVSIADLSRMGSAAPVLLVLEQQPKVDQLRAELKSADDAIQGSYEAIEKKDLARLKAIMRRFNETYDQVRKAIGDSHEESRRTTN
jgi:hypothetical protein